MLKKNNGLKDTDKKKIGTKDTDVLLKINSQKSYYQTNSEK